MKIMIAIPCFDHMDVQFVQCLEDLERPEGTKVVFAASSLIYDARNNLAMRAIKEGYDWILWLDSDMTFEPTLLKDLLATGKDFVCGSYFSRRYPYKPAIFDKCYYEQDGLVRKPIAHNYYDYPKNELFEVEAFGFAAVLTKVEALDVISTTMGLPFCPIAGFGEDLSFCIRARQIDYKLWCDSRIKVGHISKLIIDEDSYEATRNNIKEE